MERTTRSKGRVPTSAGDPPQRRVRPRTVIASVGSASLHRGAKSDPVTVAAAALADGRMVVLVDDGDRGDSGFLITAGEGCTESHIGFMRRYGSGIVSTPMSADWAARMRLGAMTASGFDLGPAFTVAVDATDGITTGISAADRARTVQVLANGASLPSDLVRPGHVFPMRARPGGVLERAGPSEAAVDLCVLAHCAPVAVASEILTDKGEVTGPSHLLRFARRHGLRHVAISEIVAHRLATEQLARRICDEAIVLSDTPVRMLTYAFPGETTHVALVRDPLGLDPYIAVHRLCVAGHMFGAASCGCHGRMQKSLARQARDGGVVVLLRLDDSDRVVHALGVRADALLVAQMLVDLGIDNATDRALRASREALAHESDPRTLGAETVPPRRQRRERVPGPAQRS